MDADRSSTPAPFARLSGHECTAAARWHVHWSWRPVLSPISSRAARPGYYHPEGGSPLAINRSIAWIVAAAAIAFVFVVVLGPGVRF